jgi:hypothetical protein
MGVVMQQLEWGLFWFDDTPGRTLEEKIKQAASRYQIKYGQPPTLCFVHPSALGDVESVGGIEVNGLKTVLPSHLWLGVGREKKAKIAPSSQSPETLERTNTDANQVSSDTCGQA